MFRRHSSKNKKASRERRRFQFESLESRVVMSAAPNDYAVISPTSLGGVLDSRHISSEEIAYLADTSLSVPGGVLTATTSGGFDVTGTLAFDASTDNSSVIDPVFYFGFFDKDNPTAGAFGFTLADQTTTSFRFRASAGTTQTAGSGTAVTEGVYTFDLDVNNVDSGAGKVQFRLFNAALTNVLDVDVTIPTGLALQADSFGILQPTSGTDSDATFSLTLSNINYDGETVISAPEPGVADLSGFTGVNNTPSQQLTIPFIQSLTYEQFQILLPLEIPFLTTQQVASIPTIGWFSTIPAASRAALTQTQVQALNIGAVRTDYLTDQQVGWLTPTQIQAVDFYQFPRLNASQVPHLLPAQVAALPSSYQLGQMTPAARAAFTLPQVQAINVGAVGISLLTAQQISYLLPSQIQALNYYDFYLLSAAQVPHLSLAQIQSIPDRTSLNQWSSASRAALTAAQVPGLNVATTMIDLLTPTQVGFLSATQIQALDIYQLKFLSPAQIPWVSTTQIAAIPDPGVFSQLTAAARAALNIPQVQALNVAGVRIELLTPTQVGYLTMAQVQAIDYYQFHLLANVQIPWLTPAQIASIPNPASFTEWSVAQRAELTPVQVQALNVVTVRIDLLAPLQVSYLSLAQINQLDFYQFHSLQPIQIQFLTTAQVASIPDRTSFSQWTAECRGALTAPQVQALNVSLLQIDLLTPVQRALLTHAQIQALSIYDIQYLTDPQILQLAPAQFAAMTGPEIVLGFSDAVQSALTREQLLSMPFDALSKFMRVELSQLPPLDYMPADHTHGELGMSNFAAPVAALVSTGTTHSTISSGNWSSPSTWLNGQIPTGVNAKVVIGAGHTVRFDAFMNTAIKTVRVDGTLTFATDANTQLKVDTIVVDTNGRLHIGTATAPIGENYTARIVIPDGGPIDTVWDPFLVSRGLVSRGEVRMHGRTVTPFATLAVEPGVGATTLQFTQVPVGWRVGDELVIAGTKVAYSPTANTPEAIFGTDRVHILAINGPNVTIEPLQYAHQSPDGYGFSVQVANTNRNIQFIAEGTAVNVQRPHIAFFDNPNVAVENVKVQGFGRTDKDKPINSSVVSNGALVPGTGTNPRARYAMHFHHTGVNPMMAPAVVRGNVVIDSPGWGYVNHQSNVVMENNVATDVVGAGFVSEDGNEIGVMRGNLAMNSIGSGDSILSRKDTHDFGHGGHGFWLQSPGIELTDNIAAGNRFSGFTIFPSSSQAMFDAANLVDESIAVGHLAIPVGTVPLRPFDRNTNYASRMGLDIWFHQTLLNDGESVIQDFKSWNTQLFGIDVPYSGHVTINNATLVGDLSQFSGMGVNTNRLTHDITLNNVTVVGFQTGVVVPPRRHTEINDGVFSNVTNFYIEKGFDTLRSVNIGGSNAFVPLTTAQLNGRTPYNVYGSGVINFGNFLDRRVDSLFSADDIQVSLVGSPALQVYFVEQTGDSIPFPTATTPAGYGPTEYLGKTNLQLWQSYGVALNGGLLPGGTEMPPGFRAYVTSAVTVTSDFDGDGDGDGADFLTWQRNLGTIAPYGGPSVGDADGDADVDGGDLGAWRTVFGAAVSAASSGESAMGLLTSGPHEGMDDMAGLVDAAQVLTEAVAPLGMVKTSDGAPRESSTTQPAPSARPAYRPPVESLVRPSDDAIAAAFAEHYDALLDFGDDFWNDLISASKVNKTDN